VHEEFAGWYASLSLGDDAAHLESRWKAVEAVVEDITKPTLELLVRLAFRTKLQMSGTEVADLRTKFAGGTTAPGDEELILLAGAALVWAMDPDDDSSSLATTMVITASCGGLRDLRLPMNIIEIAENSNRLNAQSRRQRPSLDFGKAAATALDKTEVNAAIQQANDGATGAGIQGLVTSINKVLGAIARRQMTIESKFQSYTQLQDEELDILWWLHGSYSEDLQQDFSEVSPALRPLGIARELAQLTKVLPGPISVPALLTRASVAGAPKQTIVAAVQSMPESWLDAALKEIKHENISPAVTPILFALQRRQELEGGDGWGTPWSKLSSLDEAAELEPLRFAEAAYREFVFARLG
jgi:hypothetical protein